MSAPKKSAVAALIENGVKFDLRTLHEQAAPVYEVEAQRDELLVAAKDSERLMGAMLRDLAGTDTRSATLETLRLAIERAERRKS